ncbi:DEAD/DEAH box helicase family protein [Cryptosporidium serpentis]
MINKNEDIYLYPTLYKIWLDISKLGVDNIESIKYNPECLRNNFEMMCRIVDDILITFGNVNNTKDIDRNKVTTDLIDLLGDNRIELIFYTIENVKKLSSELEALKYYYNMNIEMENKGINTYKLLSSLSFVNMDNLDMDNSYKTLETKVLISNTDNSETKSSDLNENMSKKIENTLSLINLSGNLNFSVNNKISLVQGQVHKKTELYEEVYIAPSNNNISVNTFSKNIVSIKVLPRYFWNVFEGISHFNTIQSCVFKSAYETSENILVAAPTGAGKTNIALLVILRSIETYFQLLGLQYNSSHLINLEAKNFKVIYIAPMKSLVGEITKKFTKSLKHIGLKITELTADIVISKKDLNEFHVIVTVPEKWDILTRSTLSGPSDNTTFLNTIQCIILDEIHMLGDERGPSVEAIVARTITNIEITQSKVRLVGLSATLPNWMDFAEFLHVSKEHAYYFDLKFRPVPLENTIIGIYDPVKNHSHKATKNINNNLKENTDLPQNKSFDDITNEILFSKLKETLLNGNQILVFVHSRNETVVTAEYIKSRLNGSEYIFKNIEVSKIENKNTEIQEDMPFLCKNSIKNNADLNNKKVSDFVTYKKMVAKCGSPWIQNLFKYGIGIHHAGLLPSQRRLSEKLFASGIVRVLVTTATLAWGVNLPAHQVIIKGTDVYDSKNGRYKDIGILDILQIFGRAGRPQFDVLGSAILLTKINKLHHYVRQLTYQAPIESLLGKGSELCNLINTEVCRGLILNFDDIIRWIKYTFFFVRIRKSPLYYGLTHEDILNDYDFIQSLKKIIMDSLLSLRNSKLIRYNITSGEIYATQSGRLASKYYIDFVTANIFREMLIDNNYKNSEDSNEVINFGGLNLSIIKYMKDDIDILLALGSATEFSSMVSRNDEVYELKKIKLNPFISSLLKGRILDVLDTNVKIMLLLLACTARIEIKTPTLILDSCYIIQNSIRLLMFMFEIVQLTPSNVAEQAFRILEWTKMIRMRMNYNDCMLRHFVYHYSLNNSRLNIEAEYITGKHKNVGPLKLDSIMRLENYAHWDIIKEYSVSELKNIVYSEASRILHYIKLVPNIIIENINLAPISVKVAKFDLKLKPSWQWVDRWHGMHESFILWIENPDSGGIIYSSSFVVQKKKVNELLVISEYIPILTPTPFQLIIRIISEKWVNLSFESTVNFKNIVDEFNYRSSLYYSNILSNCKDSLSKQHFTSDYTQLLDLHPLNINILNIPLLKNYYNQVKKVIFLNPIQTQLFYILYHTDENIFLGAPTGSGKTMIAEIAIFRTLFKCTNNLIPFSNCMKDKPRIVYIAPLKALAMERYNEWKILFNEYLNINILLITGNTNPTIKELFEACIYITTPEKWDSLTRRWWSEKKSYMRTVRLVIFDEIHLLGQEPRGAVIEVLICRMKFMSKVIEQTKQVDTCSVCSSIRIIGLSTSVANSKELALWMGVSAVGYFNFTSAIRPVPCTVYISGFSEKHYCPRMSAMNLPMYRFIKAHSANKPVLIFTSSRRQTRLTALAIVHFCLFENNTNKFISLDSSDEVREIALSVSDKTLKQTLEFGIGIHHAGMKENDKALVEYLFLNSKIKIVVSTSTLAWGVNFPAYLVVVKGTEFYDGYKQRYVDYPVTDIIQMIGRAGRPQFDSNAIGYIMTYEPKKQYYKRFLYDPLPLESSLHLNMLCEVINAEISARSIRNKLDAIQFLFNSFLFRRIILSPAYYDPSIFQEDYSTSIVNNDVNLRYSLISKIFEKMIDNVIETLIEKRCIQISIGESICNSTNKTDSSKYSWTELYGSSITSQDSLCNLQYFIPTFLGQVSAFFYIKCETTEFIESELYNKFANLNRDVFKVGHFLYGWVDILRFLCKSTEFNLHPVRHNEDMVCTKLSKKCPLGILPYETMQSPYQKVFLLLQCYLFGISVPVLDFVNDIHSILEQLDRIIQACLYLNVFGRIKSYSAFLSILCVQQCIKQNLHPFQSTLLQIPFIETLDDIKYIKRNYKVDTLHEFIYKSKSCPSTKKMLFLNHIDSVENIFNWIQSIPIFKIDSSIQASSKDLTCNSNNEVNCLYIQIILDKKSHIRWSSEFWFAIATIKDDKILHISKLHNSDFSLENNMLIYSIKLELSVEFISSGIIVSVNSDKYMGLSIEKVLW